MSRLMTEEAKLYFQREAALAQAREDARFARQDARMLMARVAEAFSGDAADALGTEQPPAAASAAAPAGDVRAA